MNQLFTQSYSTLLREAAVLLSGMPCMAQTMQPADLLHQAVAKLYQAPPAQIRRHPSEFGGLMRVVMKRTLVDCGGRAGAARRPDLQARCSPGSACARKAHPVRGRHTDNSHRPAP